MHWSLLISFAAMAAVIEVSPGPNFLLITRSVPTFGLSGALANCSGFSCSYALHGALATYGVSAILAAEPYLLMIIQSAGACYLLYLGIKSFILHSRHSIALELKAQPVDILLAPATGSIAMESNMTFIRNRLSITFAKNHVIRDTSLDIVLDDDSKQTQRDGLIACFRDGILISALNPKICLFYVAAFPQFIQVGTDTATSSFLLVLVHIAISTVWAIAVAVVLIYILKKAGSQHCISKLNFYSGIALIGLSMAFFTNVAKAF